MQTGRIKVEQIILHNRAPFEHLGLRFVDGVNVLSGVNGRGKTTILSYIADAFYEMARANFSNSFEGRENAYYRISSGLDAIDGNQVSFVYIRFKVDSEYVDYIDVRGEMSNEEYSQLVQLSDPMPWHESSGMFSRNQGKHVQKNKNKLINGVFENSVVTYFPAYRTDVPAYINEKYKTKEAFHQRNQYVGYLTNPIEVVDNAAQLSS